MKSENGAPLATKTEPEWTKVRSRRGRRHQPAQRTTETAQTNGTSRIPTKSAEELAKEYADFRERFLGSSCCEKLRGIVREEISPDVVGIGDREPLGKGFEDCVDGLKEGGGVDGLGGGGGGGREGMGGKSGRGRISKAVCLGLGSFDPEDGGWESRKRTWTQFVAFLLIVEELAKTTPTPIKCIFQEPLLTPRETHFLTSLSPHHTVVSSPTAFQAIDPHTLLFGIHLYMPVYRQALERSLPAVFVGTSWDVWDEINRADGLESMRRMHAHYKRVEFPRDEAGAFSSTSIYWRASSYAHEAVDAPGVGSECVNSEEATGEHKERKPLDHEPYAPQ